MGQSQSSRRRSARAAAIGSALLSVALLAGCSSGGPSEPSGTSRSLSEFFTGGTGSFAQAGKPETAASGTADSAAEFDPNDCPTVDVRQGASTFAVNTASKNPTDSAAALSGQLRADRALVHAQRDTC